MRATLKRYFDALIARREEGKDEGFSLIELIVVVAILGILVAIAIPAFNGIQDTAQTNALKAAAANGANVVASSLAQGQAAPSLASLQSGDITAVTVEGTPKLEKICVKAVGFTPAKTVYGGNGAKADGTACLA